MNQKGSNCDGIRQFLLILFMINKSYHQNHFFEIKEGAKYKIYGKTQRNR
jgi:hypothetical protein